MALADPLSRAGRLGPVWLSFGVRQHETVQQIQRAVDCAAGAHFLFGASSRHVRLDFIRGSAFVAMRFTAGGFLASYLFAFADLAPVYDAASRFRRVIFGDTFLPEAL